MYKFYGEIYEKTNAIAEKNFDLKLTAGDVLNAVEETNRRPSFYPTPAAPLPWS